MDHYADDMAALTEYLDLHDAAQAQAALHRPVLQRS
jgi:hypothetical protein